MRILITNDDGIESAGLKALEEGLSAEHDIYVIAPDSNRSGSSHGITLHNEIEIKRVDSRHIICYGSPADCVVLANLGVLDQKPDLVLSGCNLGPNLGTDIVYSGTAAAARQAVLMGGHGIALSVNGHEQPFYFTAIVDFLKKHIHEKELWAMKNAFLNINSPNVDKKGLEYKWAFPGRRTYVDKLISCATPSGKELYFVHGSIDNNQKERGSDWEAVESGFISLSKIHVHPVEDHRLN